VGEDTASDVEPASAKEEDLDEVWEEEDGEVAETMNGRKCFF